MEMVLEAELDKKKKLSESTAWPINISGRRNKKNTFFKGVIIAATVISTLTLIIHLILYFQTRCCCDQLAFSHPSSTTRWANPEVVFPMHW